MKVGYARVNTDDQTVALQIDALIEAGCRSCNTDTHHICGILNDPHRVRQILDTIHAPIDMVF